MDYEGVYGGIGKPGFGPNHFDMMTQVTICLGDPGDPQAKGISRLLSVLLTNIYTIEKKQQIMNSEFGISVTDTIRKGMDSMCNLGEGIYEEGMEKGKMSVNSLYRLLASEKKFDELERAIGDDQYLDMLLREYSLA